MSKIVLDPFITRQFSPNFKGTNLSKLVQDDYGEWLNIQYMLQINDAEIKHAGTPLLPSMWEFCKYLVIKNDFSEIKTQVLPITLDIYPFIRSGYASRTKEELPILSRWVELPPSIKLPQAKYIVCVLYSREQLQKEYNDKYHPEKDSTVKPFSMAEDAEYGIIAIMGTVLPQPDPLVPVTTMRNALGTAEGGNGEKINHEEYRKSVEFWNSHILVKSE